MKIWIWWKVVLALYRLKRKEKLKVKEAQEPLAVRNTSLMKHLGKPINIKNIWKNIMLRMET
jgi:hypothetical protein